jgi:hypothetical protein
MSIFLARKVALLAFVSMYGCGSGGGTSTPAVVASTNSFSVDAAFRNNESATRNASINISAIANGVTSSGTGTYSESALSTITFNGVSAQARTTTLNGSVLVGGQSAPFGSTGTTYYDGALLPVGSLVVSPTGVSTTSYVTSRNITALPIAAKVGDSGNFVTLDSFSNSAKTVKVSTSTNSWTLSADTSTTALLKLISTSSTGSTVTETLRITPAGAATRLQIDTTLSTGRVIFDFI